MKKSLLSVVALLSVSLLSAQEVKFGAKAGLNLSTVKFTVPDVVVGGIEASGEAQDNKFTPGFHVGGFAEIGITEKFAFQPELLFSLQGSKFESNDTETQTIFGVTNTVTTNTETTFSTSYINIPLLAKFYATEKLFFAAGPQLGFLLSAKSKSTGTATSTTTFAGSTTVETENLDSPSEDVKNEFKSLNFSLAFGGGYFITENIFAEARYTLGLSNDAEAQNIDTGLGTISAEPVAKTSAIQISVGYRF